MTVDSIRFAELAYDNEDCTWDVIYHAADVEEEEEDNVAVCRIQRTERQRERDYSTGAGGVEAAAAQLRLQLTSGYTKHQKANHMNLVFESGSCKVWLGDKKKATMNLNWLKDEGITAVVNATFDLPNLWESQQIEHHTLKLHDVEAAQEEMGSMLDDALNFIKQKQKEKQSILVHCHAGRSRSANVLLAHLVQEEGMSLGDVFSQISSHRAILPNKGFWQLLCERTQVQYSAAEYSAMSRQFIDELTTGKYQGIPGA